MAFPWFLVATMVSSSLALYSEKDMGTQTGCENGNCTMGNQQHLQRSLDDHKKQMDFPQPQYYPPPDQNGYPQYPPPPDYQAGLSQDASPSDQSKAPPPMKNPAAIPEQLPSYSSEELEISNEPLPEVQLKQMDHHYYRVPNLTPKPLKIIRGDGDHTQVFEWTTVKVNETTAEGAWVDLWLNGFQIENKKLTMQPRFTYTMEKHGSYILDVYAREPKKKESDQDKFIATARTHVLYVPQHKHDWPDFGRNQFEIYWDEKKIGRVDESKRKMGIRKIGWEAVPDATRYYVLHTHNEQVYTEGFIRATPQPSTKVNMVYKGMHEFVIIAWKVYKSGHEEVVGYSTATCKSLYGELNEAEKLILGMFTALATGTGLIGGMIGATIGWFLWKAG